jgi:hypothetical protein
MAIIRQFETKTDTTYNGWKNYETWNVALWLGNDYPIYLVAREFSTYPHPFMHFRVEMKNSSLKYTHTLDRVSLWHPRLDIKALDEHIREMNS